MKRFIILAVLVAFALSSTSAFAAYNGARNYSAKPAAAKASPSGSHSFNGKSGGKRKASKSAKSSFKSGGFKAGRR